MNTKIWRRCALANIEKTLTRSNRLQKVREGIKLITVIYRDRTIIASKMPRICFSPCVDVGEGAMVLAESEGEGERIVSLRMFGVDFGGALGERESEEVGFRGGPAVEASGEAGESLDQLRFGGRHGNAPRVRKA